MSEQNYSPEKITEITGGALVCFCSEKANISKLLTDSRTLDSPKETLFFALKGVRQDGHGFIPTLAQKGVFNFVVSEIREEWKQLPANFILVSDTLAALQAVAEYHRSQFNLPVIGITGSNGKTIVKEWLFQLLRTDHDIVRSPKSYNSQIGVPLSVFLIRDHHDLGIFEAGISRTGEMTNLQKIIKPTIGLITNIGEAHSENFKDIKIKTSEKLKLFIECEKIIYCKDYIPVYEELNGIKKPDVPDFRIFTWSRKSRADLQIARVERGDGETRIQGIYENDFREITIPFTDQASIENAIHCWSVMICLGYEQEEIATRMDLLSPVAMRLELKEGINNCSVINDSYNSDIGSLAIALDFLNQQKQHPKRTLILSDILQSGKEGNILYKEVASMLKARHVSRFIGIGEELFLHQDLFDLPKMIFKSTEEFLKEYNPAFFREETILIKGARVFGFERIVSLLHQRFHQTVLEVNLNALVQNLNYYKSLLKPTTKVMAMVKAFSYGSGSFEIANTLQFHRLDYLAVAYADEGVELRKRGIEMPIMVMNPEIQSFEAIIDYYLEPEIYSFSLLANFTEALRVKEQVEQISSFPVHIKIDTGMHRLGFEEEDINELIVKIKNSKLLKIRSIFAHLAGSDDPAHDAFTGLQIDRFKSISDEIFSHFDYPILRHIVNSAAIARFPNAQFDMARLGIGLYGVAHDQETQKQLANVGTMKTTISQIKNIPAGESIGYGRSGIASRDTQLATVAIGYADGYDRRLGNGVGKMWLNGKLVPTIGHICMDMCMLDITEVPAAEGDEVLVFGNEMPLLQLAKDIGTIPYELLTGISQRVKRVYYQE